jgi:amino acid permease
MSPSQKLIYYAGSPGRFIAKKIRPGTVSSSIFSLVIICLGAGTITIPYVFYELGFVLGSLAIIFGGSISLFAGWMLTHCSEATNGACYEEIAMASFGKRA